MLRRLLRSGARSPSRIFFWSRSKTVRPVQRGTSAAAPSNTDRSRGPTIVCSSNPTQSIACERAPLYCWLSCSAALALFAAINWQAPSSHRPRCRLLVTSVQAPLGVIMLGFTGRDRARISDLHRLSCRPVWCSELRRLAKRVLWRRSASSPIVPRLRVSLELREYLERELKVSCAPAQRRSRATSSSSRVEAAARRCARRSSTHRQYAGRLHRGTAKQRLGAPRPFRRAIAAERSQQPLA